MHVDCAFGRAPILRTHALFAPFAMSATSSPSSHKIAVFILKYCRSNDHTDRIDNMWSRRKTTTENWLRQNFHIDFGFAGDARVCTQCDQMKCKFCQCKQIKKKKQPKNRKSHFDENWFLNICRSFCDHVSCVADIQFVFYLLLSRLCVFARVFVAAGFIFRVFFISHRSAANEWGKYRWSCCCGGAENIWNRLSDERETSHSQQQ